MPSKHFKRSTSFLSWTHQYAALRLTLYLHTLLDLDASVVVVVHHLVDVAQRLQAVAVRLAHAGRGDQHAQVCKHQEQGEESVRQAAPNQQQNSPQKGITTH